MTALPPPWPHVPLAEQLPEALTETTLAEIESIRPPAPVTLVPPKLRELLEVFGELARFLPAPADGNWNIRRDRESWRGAMLTSRIDSLLDQLQVLDGYPNIAAQILESHCARGVAAIRLELAKPLGYEPDAPVAPAGESLGPHG